MTASAQHLLQTLNHELALVQRFIDILEAEANALEQSDYGEALEASTRHKNSCIGQLADAGQAREAALQAMGFGTDRAGLEAAVKTYPQLAHATDQLFDLGRQASDLNMANGAIIETYLQHTQQALHAIRQMSGSTDLYDASGRPGGSKGSRTRIAAG